MRTSNRGFPSSAVSSRPATGFQESSPSTLPPFAAFPSHASARILHNVVVGPCAPDDVPQISALPTFLEESRHEFVVSHRCAEDSDTKWITSDPRFAYRDSPSSKDCRTSSRTFCMPQLNSNGMKLFPVLMLFSCVPHPSSSAQTYEFALELHEEPGTSTNFATTWMQRTHCRKLRLCRWTELSNWACLDPFVFPPILTTPSFLVPFEPST